MKKFKTYPIHLIISKIEKTKLNIEKQKDNLTSLYKELEQTINQVSTKFDNNKSIDPLISLDNNIENLTQGLRFLEQSIQSINDSI